VIERRSRRASIGEANATTITTPIDAGTTPRRPADLSPRPANDPGADDQERRRSGCGQQHRRRSAHQHHGEVRHRGGARGAALRRAVLIATGAILVAAIVAIGCLDRCGAKRQDARRDRDVVGSPSMSLAIEGRGAPERSARPSSWSRFR